MNNTSNTLPDGTPLNTTQIKIGPYELHSIETGVFGLDGGAMFGTVPKVLWNAKIPADEKNRIPMECRCLLLVSNDKKILIDTGNGTNFIEKYGDKLGSKFAKMYNMDPDGPSLLNTLKKHGFAPEDITDVLLTHLHFDHAGGATCFDEQLNKVTATFKNAKYYVQKDNYEWALNPNRREKASYFKQNFVPLMEQGFLKLIEGDKIPLDNISINITNGHTKGQQNIIISDKNTTVFYAADLIPTSAHLGIPWIMGYDLEPLKIMEEKEAILKQAVQQNWYMFFEHDPFCALGTVKYIEAKKDYKLDKAFSLSS